MSEFLAEAQVLIRPNTALFRAELIAQLAAVTKTIPPVPVVVAAAPLSTAGVTAALATQTVATQQLAGAQNVLTASTNRAAASQIGFRKGLLASAASVTGLRGAVLAASGPFLAGAIAATAFGKSLALFAEFETELNVFAATTEATALQMERVSEVARELGADLTLPAVGSADAAKAMTELAKAGLSVEDTLAGARGVLQLSTAANIGVGEAANFAANALNSFGLAGDQATRVADVLANAANSAQGSISDFGLAFQQASAVARQVGFSLEETATTLTILAQNGLRGSDAGTSLRVALLRLVNPTQKAAEVIDELGIQIRDAQGNIRPDVFVQFGEATRAFSPAMRDAALATVFGADAIRAVAIASREGRTGLLEVTTEINRQGTAAELAAARTKGLAGQTEALKNTLAATALEAGKLGAIFAGPVLAALTALALGVKNVIAPFNALAKLIGGFQGPDFDPSAASTSELLDRIRDLREEMENSGNLGFDLFEEKITAATKSAIQNLELQKAQFKALGLDVSAIDVLIKGLQDDLRELGESKPGAGVARSLTPLQRAAEQTRQRIKDAAADGIDTTLLKKSLREIEESMLDAAEKARFAGAALAQGFNTGAAELGKPVRNILAELTEEALDIEIGGGGIESTIANLRAQEAQLRERIAVLGGAPAKRQEAKEQLVAVLNEIQSIQESEARDAESAAQKIAANALDSARAIAAALTGDRGRLENLISRAAGTDPLKDDIRFTKALVRLINSQIAEARKRIKDVEVRKTFIEASNRLLIQLLQDIKRDKEQMARDAAAALRTQQTNILEGIRLDIGLAETTGNVGREISARQRLIAALKKAQGMVKKGTLEWKRLRNEIAEETAAIAELRGEKKDQGEAFAGLAFEFLQKQQGFAANLLGNLIPGFATGGLVGGSQAQAPENLVSPTAQIQAQATGGKVAGPTFGQAATEVDILKEMLRVLRAIQSGRAHPEAGFERVLSSAVMDGQGGGGGGGQAVN